VPATAKAQNTTTTAPAPVYTTAGSTGQWFASGFVGSNFSASLDSEFDNLNDNSNNSSLEFGGNIGYTWNRVFGAEFLADFTPGFGVNRILNVDDVNRLVDDPRLNTYMFNLIAAVPISAGRFQPFISGGIGAVSLAGMSWTTPPSGRFLESQQRVADGFEHRWRRVYVRGERRFPR
jgi:hypothetical protein